MYIVSPAFAQDIPAGEQENPTLFSFSAGAANNTNSGYYGLLIANDLKTSLHKKLYINPRLSFFQSVYHKPASTAGFNSLSSLFVDLGLSYSFTIEKVHTFSLSAGPAYQLGSHTRTISQSYLDGELVDEQYKHEHIRSLGFYIDLDYQLYTNEKFIHSLALKSYSFQNKPFEFMALSYKIGLTL